MVDYVFRRRNRPLLIWLAPPLIAAASIYGLLFVALVLREAGDAAITVFGHAVTPWGVRFSVVPVAAMLIALQLILAYGFLLERSWARPLATALPLAWVLLPSLLLPLEVPRADIMAEFLLPAILGSCIIALYLYLGSGPQDYYERLAAKHDARSQAA